MKSTPHHIPKLFIVWFFIAWTSAAPVLDSTISNSFTSDNNAKTFNIIVSFRSNRVNEVRAKFISQTFNSRSHRSTSLYRALKEHAADATQGNVLRKLRTSLTSNTQVKQLWISNQLVIKNASQNLIKNLLEMEDISVISDETFVKLNEPVSKSPATIESPTERPWGIESVEAPAIWESGINGSGVVLANIDTGVLHTHEALRDNYRNSHGWYDPVKGNPTPYDDHSHGTHVMGTAVGRGQGIGVAPGATWIACKGCTLDGECSRIDLLLCGQWVTCPDAEDENPQCDAPNVVSNSWVEDTGSHWYDDVLVSWLILDITPVFGIGNDGPKCGSARSPGDSVLALGIGAYNSSNFMASFSSVGPPALAQFKPDIAAPGVAVLSATNSAPNAYATFSGTSMATPHVAGLVALLYSKKLDLQAWQVPVILSAGAMPVNSSGGNCGGIDDTVYPNNHAGMGKINAVTSFSRWESLMAETSQQ